MLRVFAGCDVELQQRILANLHVKLDQQHISIT